MAFRNARVPRLTLFSGPNCSLCDVRQIKTYDEPTLTLLIDRKISFGQGPTAGARCAIFRQINGLIITRPKRDFQLDTVNIQDAGQEKWKRKYVYWIPALHLEGKEIAKGRWDESVVLQALKEWDQSQSEPQATREETPTDSLK